MPRKDLERSALMMDKIKNPAKSKNFYSTTIMGSREDGDLARVGNKTKGYLAATYSDGSTRYESGSRATKNIESPGYGKKNKDIEIVVSSEGATKQKGGKVKNISKRRANRIIDRFENKSN